MSELPQTDPDLHAIFGMDGAPEGAEDVFSVERAEADIELEADRRRGPGRRPVRRDHRGRSLAGDARG